MIDWPSVPDWMAAMATIAALLLAVWQLRQNSKLASQNFAREMWLEYLRLGLDNADLGETRIALKYLKIASTEQLISGDTIESQRYLWFLTVLLDACEVILLHTPTGKWIVTIEENVSYHKEALVVLWPRERQYYSDEFDVLVQRVLDAPPK